MKMFVSKTTAEITEEDLHFYFDVLSKRLTQLIEEEGKPFDHATEMERVHSDLRHFFRDNKAVLYQYLEEDKIVGLVCVRDIADGLIFVHECQALDPKRRSEIMKVLLRHVKAKHPGKSAYGVIHQTSERLRKFCQAFGAQLCDTFYQEEHPAITQENGWISWIYRVE